MKRIGLFAITLLAVPAFVQATALTGQLTVNATGNVAVGLCTGSTSNFCIDFDYTGGLGTDTTNNVQIATGTVDGNSDSAAYNISNNFVTLNGGTANGGGTPPATQVIVADLNSAAEPIGTMVSDPNFVTFNNGSVWNITLTEVQNGVDGATGCSASVAAGTTCTPPGTPFNMENTGTCSAGNLANCNVTISFTFLGTANNGSATSSVSGTFQTTFSGTDYQNILAAIGKGEDVVTSNSGTFFMTPVTGVPEPITSALIGVGLLGLGVMRRKRRSV